LSMLMWLLRNEDGGFVETLVEITILALGTAAIATRLNGSMNTKANALQTGITGLTTPN